VEAQQTVVKRPIPLSTNYAVAYAVKDLDVDVVAAYPITPQTTVVEKRRRSRSSSPTGSLTLSSYT